MTLPTPPLLSTAVRGPASGESNGSPTSTPQPDLRSLGLVNPGTVHANLSSPALIEQAVARGEGLLTDRGALAAYTGKRTGRSPKDRFLIADPACSEPLWWGAINRPFDASAFDRLYDRARAYLQRRDLFIFDGWACADPRHRLRVRVVAEKAWHTLFARCLLLRPKAGELTDYVPDLTIVAVADMHAEA